MSQAPEASRNGQVINLAPGHYIPLRLANAYLSLHSPCLSNELAVGTCSYYPEPSFKWPEGAQGSKAFCVSAKLKQCGC